MHRKSENYCFCREHSYSAPCVQAVLGADIDRPEDPTPVGWGIKLEDVEFQEHTSNGKLFQLK